MILLICGIKKKDTNESIYKTETDSQTQKANLWSPKGKGSWGGINEEYGINRYTLLYVKQISNKDLLCNTRNNIQYLIITYNGKLYVYVCAYIYVCVCIYVSESLCGTPEINTIL